MQVVPIPAFEDNYIWVIRAGDQAAAVDPGDAAPLVAWLEAEGVRLTAVLSTHRHMDHVGGNQALAARFGVPVYGPAREPIPALTHPVDDGDRLEIPGLGLQLTVIGVPGHTLGHVAYYGANSLFCGDTLFGCGCGRLFEGTPRQMQASLAKLAALPDDTLVYSAHEYTLSGLAFAGRIEPENADIAARMLADSARVDHDRPTLPSTLGLEKSTNPFLRWDAPAVIECARRHRGSEPPDAAAVFAAIREIKDGE